MEKKRIEELLTQVIHPETQTDIVTSGMLGEVRTNAEGVTITLQLFKQNDPFTRSIIRNIEQTLTTADESLTGKISVITKAPAPKTIAEKPKATPLTVRQVIAVASGKGGVGKSTVTANLATALSRTGYRVGVLDADIYGPSMPKMFGLEGYSPDVQQIDGRDRIVPAEINGIKIMSIGFFIRPEDALLWRGPMASSALRQLIHDTLWGELDFLLIDLPPGTGDVHLTLISELKLTGAVIVTTPQQVALADVVRGISMFNAENVNVPVLGLIENMAWFTPAELPNNRYYIFGHDGGKNLAAQSNLPLLGQIPLIQGVCEGGDRGTPAAASDDATAEYFRATARELIAHLK